MARQLVKGWEWVKHCKLTPRDRRPKKQEEDIILPKRSSTADAFKTVAVVAVAVLGVAGIAAYQRQQARQVVYGPPEVQVVYEPAPPPKPVRQLELTIASTTNGIESVFQVAAECWPQWQWLDPDQLEELIWTRALPNVRYPGKAQPGDHPSVSETRTLIRWAIAGARAEQIRQEAAASEPQAEEPPRKSLLEALATFVPPETKTPKREKIETLTSEWPRPGRFYRLDEDIAESGLERVASLALAFAVAEQGKRKGWTEDKTKIQAGRVMENIRLCADYTRLIEQSQWNAECVQQPRAGQLVWCPPIQTRSLADRSRTTKAVLDQRPWSDGSSRLEPPPSVWHQGSPLRSDSTHASAGKRDIADSPIASIDSQTSPSRSLN